MAQKFYGWNERKLTTDASNGMHIDNKILMIH